MPILAVVGMAATGEREVLAFRIGDRENQQAWEDLLEDIKHRAVKEIGLWGSRWEPEHDQCDHQEIPQRGSEAVCRSQNGQCARLRSQQTARAG